MGAVPELRLAGGKTTEFRESGLISRVICSFSREVMGEWEFNFENEHKRKKYYCDSRDLLT